MNRIVRYPVWLLATLLVVCTARATQQEARRGTITGTVLNERRQPVEGAKVNAESANGRPVMGAIRFVETDKEGRFSLDRLDFGEYRIFAQKPADKYSDQNWSFYYGNARPPKTLISPEVPSVDVVVRVGPKAGVIVGAVVDADSGDPINNANFILRRAESPNQWMSTSSPPNFSILIPPSTPVMIEVNARGYRPWVYIDPQGYGRSLRLEPEAEARLEVRLVPVHTEVSRVNQH